MRRKAKVSFSYATLTDRMIAQIRANIRSDQRAKHARYNRRRFTSRRLMLSYAHRATLGTEE